MAELMEVPPGGGLEEDASAVVAQPGPPGVRADVGRPRAASGHGATAGQEEGAAGAARPVWEAQEPRQQVGGARAPVHPLGLAAQATSVARPSGYALSMTTP